jgi:hypothetical protein
VHWHGRRVVVDGAHGFEGTVELVLQSEELEVRVCCQVLEQLGVTLV